MATLDRQIPSPDSFLCEPWSSFVTAAKLRFVDNSSSDDKQIYCQGKAVRLSKEARGVIFSGDTGTTLPDMADNVQITISKHTL
ncbi:ataxin-7-like protein 1 [Notothenia coriiceps]|uniref:Ataxin-7-like protein 1 n=1 Tax=Notothenia coriiceps TaxID=8208 RepID=A0A6I9PJH0_9TELE|nr:PREDICTED: ataxin-7-like protein 1 [Notothenia coriiceps]